MGSRGDRRWDKAAYKEPPRLQFLFEGEATLSEPLDIGAVPAGHRLVIAIEAGGRIDGPHMHGRFLAGSSAAFLTRPDGVVEIHGRTLFGMEDDQIVLMHSHGIRRIATEAVEALSQGRLYDPAMLYSRAICLFEAAEDGPYAWLNRGIFLGRSSRTVEEFRMSCWEIL